MPDLWSTPPANLSLPAGEVHVWRASLDLTPDALNQLKNGLTADEVLRTNRFVFDRDRDRFAAARGVLRALLGRYLQQSPIGVQIVCTPSGKPTLVGNSLICFNLSHSHEFAVYAFSRKRELGIDLEKIRADVAVQEIAERYFSGNEIAEWRSLPEESRAHGFFLCWTRKEAYVKARGEGLQIPLSSFDVTLTPERPPILISPDAGRWSLRSFEPAPGYIASLVTEGSDWTLRYWDWGAAAAD